MEILFGEITNNWIKVEAGRLFKQPATGAALRKCNQEFRKIKFNFPIKYSSIQE